MDIEQRQSQVIEQLVKQASTLSASSSLTALIVQATSHPSLFAFSEILSLPNLLQLQGTENSSYIDLLRLFAYGTWRDYKSNAGTLPNLIPDQILKIKQLTVLTLAETNKLLSYDTLLEELELSNVRELEDFLINDCMYAGIVKGKLDHLRRSFQVQYAAGRDLMHGQLRNMIETLTKWLATSDNLLSLIEEKIDWVSTMCHVEMNHQKEVQDRIEEAKKSLHFKKPQPIPKQGYNFWSQDDLFYDFDGAMDHEEDNIRSKRRRSPNNFRQRRTPHF